MNNPTVRLIVAVIVGIVVGGVVVFVIEGAGHMLYPPPADLDLKDPAAMAVIMERMPVEAKVGVILGWFLGSLAGAWVANLIARRPLAGWLVALLFLAMSAYTFTYIPHPLWMIVAGLAAPLLSAWLAARMTQRQRTANQMM